MAIATECSQEKPTLHLLQIYRGLAAIAVLLFHAAGITYDKTGSSGIGRIFAWGFNGVPLFFVLSGYIIAFIHINDINNPRQAFSYLYKRFARIYPIYWVALLLYLPTHTFNITTPVVPYIIENISLLKITGFSKILPVAWTLSHEILFYIAFLFLVINKKLGLACVFIWLSLVAYKLSTGHAAPPPYTLTTISGVEYNVFISLTELVSAPINLLFLLGVLSHFTGEIISRHRHGEIVAQYAFISGIALFATANSYLAYKTTGRIFDYDAANFQLICGIASFLLILSASSRRLDAWAKRQSVLLFLGSASYSIYLVHYNIQQFLVDNFLSRFDANTAFISASMISIAAGAAVHKFLEKPILGALSRNHVRPFLRAQS